MFLNHIIVSGSIGLGFTFHAIFIEGAREAMFIAALASLTAAVAFIIAEETRNWNLKDKKSTGTTYPGPD